MDHLAVQHPRPQTIQQAYSTQSNSTTEMSTIPTHKNKEPKGLENM